MTIISVSGKKASGKDTLANLLVKKHGFTKISLADPLRDLCCKVFDIPMEWFLDRDKKDSSMPSTIELDYKQLDNIADYVENNWGFVVTNEMREQMDLSYGVELETPRDILKFVGTELLRKHLRDDLWIVLALSRIKDIGQKVVVADVRFDNERDVFRRAGGTLVLIKRPDVEVEDNHISEDTGDEEQYDTIFNNIASLNMFEADVDLWYTLKRETFNRVDLKYAY
jgi:hypothetical protein